MTTPAGAQIPGADVLAWAAGQLGIDISDSLRKAGEIMATDPVAIRLGMERLAAITGGLGTTQQGLQQDGTAAAQDWSGAAATTFAPTMSKMDGNLADSGNGVTQVNGTLGTAATAFEGGQNVVMTVTPATAAALRVMWT